jgi:hypothetical protein
VLTLILLPGFFLLSSVLQPRVRCSPLCDFALVGALGSNSVVPSALELTDRALFPVDPRRHLRPPLHHPLLFASRRRRRQRAPPETAARASTRPRQPPLPSSTMPKATSPDPERIPRPPNRWILYRADKVRELEPPPGQPRRPQAEISKLISQMWAAEPPHVKAAYESRAIQAKIQHAIDFPEYQYLPEKKEVRAAKRKERRELQAKERAEAKHTRVRPQRPYATRAPYTAVPYSHYAAAFNYTPPEVRFGPAGPSPPLSAASTPEPEEVTNNSVASTSATQLPTPAAVGTSPTHLQVSPSLDGVSLPTPTDTEATTSHSTPEQHPAPWSEAWPQQPASEEPKSPDTREEEERPTAHGELHIPPPPLDEVTSPSVLAFRAISNTSFVQLVHFAIPSLGDGAQDWAGLHGAIDLNDLTFDAHNFAGLLASTGDPSMFTLPEFDANFLLQQPIGPIETSSGSLLPPTGEGTDVQHPLPQLLPHNEEDPFAQFDWSNIGPPAVEDNPTLHAPLLAHPSYNGTPLYYPSSSTTPAPFAPMPITPFSSESGTPAPDVEMFSQPPSRAASTSFAEMMSYINFPPPSRSVSGTSTATEPVAPEPVHPEMHPSLHSAASTGATPSSSTAVPGELIIQQYHFLATAPPSHGIQPAHTPDPSGYTPPPGARRSSERRVAGSWRPAQIPRIPG